MSGDRVRIGLGRQRGTIMSDRRAGSGFRRFAALAEIFLLLALGNIVGIAIYDAVLPASATCAEAGGIAEALYGGLRILLRIGLVAAFGLALLWFRRGLTPRDAGLTRADKPLGYLVGVGILLGGFSSFLIGLVFAVHAVVPHGRAAGARRAGSVNYHCGPVHGEGEIARRNHWVATPAEGPLLYG